MRRAGLLPIGLLTACLGTQDVSLGELLADAAAADDAALTPRTPDESRDVAAPGAREDDEEEPEPDTVEPEPEPRRDAGSLDAGSSDAAEARDSGPLNDASSPTDAGRASDASTRSEEGGRDADADAARADAGDAGDGSLPLICQIEPWHCW
jgi:hypothetical protein